MLAITIVFAVVFAIIAICLTFVVYKALILVNESNKRLIVIAEDLAKRMADTEWTLQSALNDLETKQNGEVQYDTDVFDGQNIDTGI